MDGERFLETGFRARKVADDVVGHPSIEERARIVASVTPYAARYVRLGPSILNSPEEVDLALRTIRGLT